MLSMTNISKVFRTDLIETHALRDFSLEVKAGEFLAVTGPSGSGKTTFLNIAGLLEPYDSGTYRLDGVDVTQLSDDARSNLRNQKIGFIFQSFNLMPDLNVYDNVDVPLRYRRMKAAERDKRITNALEIVGLAARMKHIPAQLSGGQQQRVAIARAIAGDPKLVLADEPTGNLDSLMARQVMDLLEKINEMGTTIIMVTHDPELARRAHRNVQVVDGQISDFKPFDSHGTAVHAHLKAVENTAGAWEMFAYYLRLALASFRRNPGLTALMVFAIALGISVCMITLTSYRAAAHNPAGEHGKVLFAASIDSWDPENAYEDDNKTLAPTLLTYNDAKALYASNIPDRKVMMYKGGGILSRGDKGMEPEYVSTRMTTADFFPMFDVPFLYGAPWDAKADAGPDPVMILSKETNQKAFGGVNSVGKTVRWHDREFRVIGVLDEWTPAPKYFDVSNGSFNDNEGAYVPVAWGPILEMGSHGNTNCWKTEVINNFQDFMNSECVWMADWFEIRSAEKQRAFREFLDNYVMEQKAHGRFPRPLNNYLYDVDGWLKRNKVVGDDNKAMLLLAFAFLAVCLVNTVGLLLAKFLNAAPAAGVRRALGASRRDIFLQHLTESGLVALAGGLAGGLLGWCGVWAMRAWYMRFLDAPLKFIPFDATNFVIVVGIAVLEGILAGLYPAWRIGHAAPASYLKVQ